MKPRFPEQIYIGVVLECTAFQVIYDHGVPTYLLTFNFKFPKKSF